MNKEKVLSLPQILAVSFFGLGLITHVVWSRFGTTSGVSDRFSELRTHPFLVAVTKKKGKGFGYVPPFAMITSNSRSRTQITPVCRLATDNMVQKLHFSIFYTKTCYIVKPSNTPGVYLELSTKDLKTPEGKLRYTQFLEQYAKGFEPLTTMVDLENKHGLHLGFQPYEETHIPVMKKLTESDYVSLQEDLKSRNLAFFPELQKVPLSKGWYWEYLQRLHLNPQQLRYIMDLSAAVRNEDFTLVFLGTPNLNAKTDSVEAALKIDSSDKSFFEFLERRKSTFLNVIKEASVVDLGFHKNAPKEVVELWKSYLITTLNMEYTNEITMIEQKFNHDFPNLSAEQQKNISIPFMVLKRNINMLEELCRKDLRTVLTDLNNLFVRFTPVKAHQVESVKQGQDILEARLNKFNKVLTRIGTLQDINSTLIKYISLQLRYKYLGEQSYEPSKNSLEAVIQSYQLKVNFLVSHLSQTLFLPPAVMDIICTATQKKALQMIPTSLKNQMLGGITLEKLQPSSSDEMTYQYIIQTLLNEKCCNFKNYTVKGSNSNSGIEPLSVILPAIPNVDFAGPSTQSPLPTSVPRKRGGQGTQSLSHPQFPHNQTTNSLSIPLSLEPKYPGVNSTTETGEEVEKTLQKMALSQSKQKR